MASDLDVICSDCSVDCGKLLEYAYMVHDDIWKPVSDAKYLCISCLETRLGRELNKSDFPDDILLNEMHWQQSERLKRRMARERQRS